MNNESSDIRNLVVEIRKDILTLVKTDHYDESWRVLECLKDLHVHLDDLAAKMSCKIMRLEMNRKEESK